jgi:hypothetical protein
MIKKPKMVLVHVMVEQVTKKRIQRAQARMAAQRGAATFSQTLRVLIHEGLNRLEGR